MAPETRYVRSCEHHIAYQVVGEGPIDLATSGQVDVRAVLGAIQTPTLVLHRAGDQAVDIRHSRYLADHIPGARYVELPGEEALSFGSDAEPLLEEIEEFLTGARHGGDAERSLATVMAPASSSACSCAAGCTRVSSSWSATTWAGSPCTSARASSPTPVRAILVSSAVKDLVVGSGIRFEDRGERELRSLPGRWRLWAVAAPGRAGRPSLAASTSEGQPVQR